MTRRTHVSLAAGLALTALSGLGLTVVGAAHVAAAGAPAPAAAAAAADPVVMRLSRTTTACSLSRVSSRHRLQVEETVLGARRVYRVTRTDPDLDRGAERAEALADDLRRDACIGFAEADSLLTLRGDRFHSWTEDPPEAAVAADWQSQRATRDLGLSGAHRTSRGAGSVVAVLDTGVDATHPGLSRRLLAGWDYVDGDNLPDDSACRCDTDRDGRVDGAVGHGTYVAGTVGLVAPAARILPLRVLDSNGQGTVFAAAQAILDAVDADVDVINLSFGTDDDERSPLLNEAIAAAETAGILVVAAAGNSGDAIPHYPANLASVMAVASTDATNTRLASFSSHGRWVSVAAVGENIVGLAPDGRYVRWSGTSASTPVVAAQGALLRTASPSLSVSDLRNVITGTTSPLTVRKIMHGRVEPTASLSEATDATAR